LREKERVRPRRENEAELIQQGAEFGCLLLRERMGVRVHARKAGTFNAQRSTFNVELRN
jgi:hypothetical protein